MQVIGSEGSSEVIVTRLLLVVGAVLLFESLLARVPGSEILVYRNEGSLGV